MKSALRQVPTYTNIRRGRDPEPNIKRQNTLLLHITSTPCDYFRHKPRWPTRDSLKCRFSNAKRRKEVLQLESVRLALVFHAMARIVKIFGLVQPFCQDHHFRLLGDAMTRRLNGVFLTSVKLFDSSEINEVIRRMLVKATKTSCSIGQQTGNACGEEAEVPPSQAVQSMGN